MLTNHSNQKASSKQVQEVLCTPIKWVMPYNSAAYVVCSFFFFFVGVGVKKKEKKKEKEST